ncbi:MAG: CHAT domain-containing protein [Cyanobium sp. M30B3]|nr:MAG: CHAT domain-containing protein [Cyanobium sp. M30B3]
MNAVSLQLQPEGTGGVQLAAFLLAPAQQLAFSVALPGRLLQSYNAWRSRFLAHHSSSDQAGPGEDVVRHYGAQLCRELSEWLQQPDWQPLQQCLKRHPSLPLLISTADSRLELLPWEALPLERPIWRQPPPRSNGQHAPVPPSRVKVRRPRMLLLVGDEHTLDLEEERKQLQQLDREGRLSLTTLRGSDCSLQQLHRRLLDPAGWDGLVFLGHSDRDGNAGGRLQLGDGSWLPAAAFQQELNTAAQRGLQLVLLSSCSGTDLAATAAAAGIPWTVCFREPVPDRAAATGFSRLLGELQGGSSLFEAMESCRRELEHEGPAGSHLLLSGYTAGLAPPLQLPLRRQQLLSRRLASSTSGQLAAATSCCLLAAVSALVPWNPVSSYLLDRRLELQRQWRQLTGQLGPAGEPLPVLLIDPDRVQADFGAAPTPGRLPRQALADVLRRTPVARVPKVGLDVVLDEEAPHSDELAAVLRQQQRPLVISGWFGDDTAAVKPGRRSQVLTAKLEDSGLQTRRLDVNTPGRSAGAGPQPLPLRLSKPINAEHFAAAMASHSAPLLPADAVIDWSIDWRRLIRPVQPADLPSLEASSLLVGSTGSVDPANPDLFAAPGAAGSALAQLSGGSARAIPGALVQAALAQSITLNHWLRPLPLLPITALTAGLGVLLAAGIGDRNRRLLLVGGIAVLAVPIALQLAVSALLVLPLLLPLTALASCAGLRQD